MVISSCRVRLRRLDNRSSKTMAVVTKVVLRATASHETDLSSKLRSRCGAAPIFGFAFCRRIVWPAQQSVRLPCVFCGGRSLFCAAAIGCVAGAACSQTALAADRFFILGWSPSYASQFVAFCVIPLRAVFSPKASRRVLPCGDLGQVTQSQVAQSQVT